MRYILKKDSQLARTFFNHNLGSRSAIISILIKVICLIMPCNEKNDCTDRNCTILYLNTTSSIYQQVK